MDVCSAGAISVRAGNITLKAPEKGCADDKPDSPKKRITMERVIWGIALAVLAFALIWFNFLDPAGRKETEPVPVQTQVTEGTAPVVTGYEEGQQLQDFTIDTIGGGSFTLSEYRGKVVYINLWATYCGPCVQELPYFDEFCKAHSDDVEVLAVHSSVIAKTTPEEFLSDKSYSIKFAADTSDDLVWNIVNGTSAMPQTIVVDRDGIVIYNEHGSISPEVLEALYNKASAKDN